jgi:hypothetical protein
MGANAFQNRQSAKTADEAFQMLVERARYEYGHRGYTGTIAEKEDFRMEEPRHDETPRTCVTRCLDDLDHWSGDKWGPAACVDGGPDPKQQGLRIFHFFGWAAS